MVKIIEKSDEEKLNEVRESRLESIAKEALGEKFKVSRSSLSICFQDKNYNLKFFVSLIPNQNKIKVNDPNYLKDAISLAEVYEKSGETEFTVNKNYD